MIVAARYPSVEVRVGGLLVRTHTFQRTTLVHRAHDGAGIYFGLGISGMERMILYPAMFWAIGFGAYRARQRE